MRRRLPHIKVEFEGVKPPQDSQGGWGGREAPQHAATLGLSFQIYDRATGGHQAWTNSIYQSGIISNCLA